MMYLKELMKEKNMTRADLSHASSIPESTLRDILNNKTQIDRCEAATLMCIADALDTTVEDILINNWEERMDDIAEPRKKTLHDQNPLLDFYALVDNTLHKLGKCSETAFVRLDRGMFLDAGQYRFALFLLGLTDYLCRKNKLHLFSRFNDYRSRCLDQPVYSMRIPGRECDLSAYERPGSRHEANALSGARQVQDLHDRRETSSNRMIRKTQAEQALQGGGHHDPVYFGRNQSDLSVRSHQQERCHARAL